MLLYDAHASGDEELLGRVHPLAGSDRDTFFSDLAKMLGINRSVRCGSNGTSLNHPGQFVASEKVSPTQTPTERISRSLPTKNKNSIGTKPSKLASWDTAFLASEAETQKSKLVST